MKMPARTPIRPFEGSALARRRPIGADRGRGLRALAGNAALALCCGSAACAGPGQLDPQPIERLAVAPVDRMEALRSAIDEDHETLQSLVSRERGEQALPLYAEPALRAIARRLGPHEDELARLRADATADDAVWTPR